MKKVAQEFALLSKDFPCLQPDPFGSISQGVNLTVQSPTCMSSAMAPPSSHLLNTSKGGGVKRFCLALRLSRRQAYFLPLPRPLILSFAGRHRADHRAIGLGDYVLSSDRRVRLETAADILSQAVP